jgi:phage-related baseplate assembly protein
VIAGSTSAAAQDQQSIECLRDQCGDTLGALSPNGPPDAYEYVCKNAALTGVTEINRATAIGDSDEGIVTVYVASADGAVSAESVAAAQTAVELWATPLCIRPFVESAVPLSVPVTAQILGDSIPADYAALINGALGELFLSLPIGGVVYRSRLIATIHSAVPQATNVILISPALDVTPTADQVPIVGAVSVLAL